MFKGTPGPWVADFDCYPFMVRSETEKWPLVDELGNEEGQDGAFICNVGDNKANAQLISAAPELLEALIDVLDQIPLVDSSYFDTPTAKKARAAIAKATGEAL